MVEESSLLGWQGLLSDPNKSDSNIMVLCPGLGNASSGTSLHLLFKHQPSTGSATVMMVLFYFLIVGIHNK